MQLLRQLGLIRSLSSLLTELPPQYNVNDLTEQISRPTAPSEADQSMLDLVCPDQDARMISFLPGVVFKRAEKRIIGCFNLFKFQRIIIRAT